MDRFRSFVGATVLALAACLACGTAFGQTISVVHEIGGVTAADGDHFRWTHEREAEVAELCLLVSERLQIASKIIQCAFLAFPLCFERF